MANDGLEASAVLASFLLGWGRRISYSPSHARLIKHEEDWKFDVRLKTKIVGVGDRLFASGRSVCAEAGRQAATKRSRQQGSRPTQGGKAAAEQQQSGRQKGRQKGKALKRLLSNPLSAFD